ncbi:MAG: hypothetical protein DMG44_10620 [Acidobacteria bacterium]|nr:MAG: hypothetical protein DMG44_10620 [Acidobacteriota bacterium]
MAEKPYRVIVEGEGGQGTQVFEADSPEEMLGQFKQAQTHATNKIRQQEQELAQLRQLALQAQANNGNGHQVVDRDQRVQELLSDPDAAIERAICNKLGVNSLQEVVQDYAGVRQGSIQARINAAGEVFLQTHPEWNSLSTEQANQNARVIGAIVEENGWDPTDPKDLDKGYGLAMGTGKIKGLVGTVDVPSFMAPVPTTVTRPSAQPNTSESEQQFYQTAKSAEDIKNYILKKHGQKP